jgi:hypothetical protein
MAELKSHNEPSMEEILASIRRIIAEDDGTQLSPSPPGLVVPPGIGRGMPSQQPAMSDGESSQNGGADATSRDFPPIPASVVPLQSAPVPPVQEAILDLTERVDHEDRPVSDRPVSRAAGTAPNPAPPLGRISRPPPLKSGAAPESPPPGETARRSVSASVATLTQIASISQNAREPELPLGETGRTLEEMVRELLRPHLKEWLDAHLPRLVERMVRDEINRLVRDAQDQ